MSADGVCVREGGGGRERESVCVCNRRQHRLSVTCSSNP